jgi:glutamyl-tRNA synthetase
MTRIEYRGRIAPSPTGFLHIGHALTFWRAQERACAAGGKLILRIEDIDRARCRSEFLDAAIEDLDWFGLDWDEGPDIGGHCAPYVQSERRQHYLKAFEKLRAGGFIYPCRCSRKDVLSAAGAPHDESEEPIYPGTCRLLPIAEGRASAGPHLKCTTRESLARPEARPSKAMPEANWHFRVPDGEELSFVDVRLGRQTAVAGRDFGDFIVWRRDHMPAYQLAVVVDDASMQITEVVRGEDLVLSAFRQLLLYRALELSAPEFFHAPLILGETGNPLCQTRRFGFSTGTAREQRRA